MEDGCKQRVNNGDPRGVHKMLLRAFEKCLDRRKLEEFKEASPDRKQLLIDDLLEDITVLMQRRLHPSRAKLGVEATAAVFPALRYDSVFFYKEKWGTMLINAVDHFCSRACFKIIRLFNTYVKISGLKPTRNPLVLPSDDRIDSFGLALTEDGFVAVAVTQAFHNAFCNHPENFSCSKVIPYAEVEVAQEDPAITKNAEIDFSALFDACEVPLTDFGMGTSLEFDADFFDKLGAVEVDIYDAETEVEDIYDAETEVEDNADVGEKRKRGGDKCFGDEAADPFDFPPPPLIPAPAPPINANGDRVSRVERELSNCTGDERDEMIRMLTLLEGKVHSIRTALYGEMNISFDLGLEDL